MRAASQACRHTCPPPCWSTSPRKAAVPLWSSQQKGGGGLPAECLLCHPAIFMAARARVVILRVKGSGAALNDCREPSRFVGLWLPRVTRAAAAFSRLRIPAAPHPHGVICTEPLNSHCYHCMSFAPSCGAACHQAASTHHGVLLADNFRVLKPLNPNQQYWKSFTQCYIPSVHPCSFSWRSPKWRSTRQTWGWRTTIIQCHSPAFLNSSISGALHPLETRPPVAKHAADI